jgi:hypothetical protein
VQKNRNIKPKIRRKAKKWPDIWRGQHQALKVQQALISFTQEIIIRKDFSRGTQKRIFQTKTPQTRHTPYAPPAGFLF